MRMENRAFEDESSRYLPEEDPFPRGNPQSPLRTNNLARPSEMFLPEVSPVLECHVYEDIVSSRHFDTLTGRGCHGGCHVSSPYTSDVLATSSICNQDPVDLNTSFHRNLTLPLRRTSQIRDGVTSCNPTSSSVRVTNKEKTRGSRMCLEENGDDGCDRPTRRRRKKDCKHCKNKLAKTSEDATVGRCRDELSFLDERNPEFRGVGNESIFSVPEGRLSSFPQVPNGKSTCNNGSPSTVYSISCNNVAKDCNTNGRGSFKLLNYDKNDVAARLAHVEVCEDKALITPPKNRANMKVNSIYVQEHWHAKDPRIFVSDPKDSHFQRAYSVVSSNSPISENRANLRRSVRDEPAPHPARLRKNRHGWTLHFASPLTGPRCTRTVILLLIVILALLGIGGIALYIVFEPDKLQVLQQYLRSPSRNNSINATSSFVIDGVDSNFSTTSMATRSLPFFDVLLDRALSSVPPNDTIVSASTEGASTSTILIMGPTSTTTIAASTIGYIKYNATRFCGDCLEEEVCVAQVHEELPYCRKGLDLSDPSGCAGLCTNPLQHCTREGVNSFRCIENEQHCFDDEWTCLNIFCIPLVKRCDGHMNCYDHSDEYNCECDLETHFHCGNNSSCLPLSKKCDGNVDCWDATDEMNCTISENIVCPSKKEMTCANGQCILRTRFCDGFQDCEDASDEPHGCHGKCNKHEFTCHNGRCISKSEKCNGIDDCGDGSDEQHCRERT